MKYIGDGRENDCYQWDRVVPMSVLHRFSRHSRTPEIQASVIPFLLKKRPIVNEVRRQSLSDPKSRTLIVFNWRIHCLPLFSVNLFRQSLLSEWRVVLTNRMNGTSIWFSYRALFWLIWTQLHWFGSSEVEHVHKTKYSLPVFSKRSDPLEKKLRTASLAETFSYLSAVVLHLDRGSTVAEVVE